MEANTNVEPEPYFVRTSERGTYRECRRLWDFTSPNGPLHSGGPYETGTEPAKTDRNLSFGVAVHKGLEAYYDPESWNFPQDVKLNMALMTFRGAIHSQKKKRNEIFGGLDSEEEQQYEEQLELGTEMLKAYSGWAFHQDERFTPIAVEKLIRVPVVDPEGNTLIIKGRPVYYQARLDLVLRDNDTGSLWTADHKTARALGDIRFLDVDTQMMAYSWAASIYYGEKVAGVIYNELVKSSPHPPNINKNGSLSKNKQQETNYRLYMQTIQQRNLNPADYEDFLSYLSLNEKDYFRRTQLHHTMEELRSQEKYIYQEVKEMLNDPDIYPSPSKFKCNWCAFITPCTVANEGTKQDVEFILKDPNLYRARESESAVVKEES